MTKPSLLDTHQHLLYTDSISYGWTDGLPALANKSFTLDDYRQLTAGLGVGGTLFMETAADNTDYKKENALIAKLADDDTGGIRGLISTCRPESDADFDEWLENCEAWPVVGYRRILHVVDDAMSQEEGFRNNVRKLGARNKVFDICFLQRQLGIAAEFARACDNTKLVLNHCGVPDIVGGDIKEWQQGIDALAELPHVYCKLSGLLAYCGDKPATLETIRPYVDYVLEKFGPYRMVWGSDWPVVNLANGIADWIKVTREILAGLSEDEANAIAHGTAEQVYKVSLV